MASSGWARSDPSNSRDRAYLLGFQMSVASFHLPPTLRQTTAYLAVISCGGWLFDLSLTVPISRAALGPSASTSTVVNFASSICCAACRQKASIAARPLTISAPGGSTKASSVHRGYRRSVALVEGRRPGIVELYDCRLV